MDSVLGVQCTCHLLRTRIATAEEAAARRSLSFTLCNCHGSHGFLDNICSTKIGSTETQRIITIKRTLKDLQLLHLFLPGKLMASIARLSFFYHYHNAYRIGQEIPEL